MLQKTCKNQLLAKSGWSFATGLFALIVSHSVVAAPAQDPLFLTTSAPPLVTLAMSVDNELFKKAYNDYSNLDGGILRMEDTTYRNDFSYYGYFDSDWCYTYTPNTGTPGNSYFAPHSAATDHKCPATGAATVAGGWSGNFLNWATMTRVDILRRVLFGGKRSVDTTTNTILERAHLPKDIHAFVKVYEGSDMGDYTPYTRTSSRPAISLCSVSTGDNGYPTVRVASGRWRQWSASEVDQCRWRSERNYTTNPQAANELVTLTAKVQVCVAGRDAETSTRCRQYGANYKPAGLLQVHGEEGKIHFGLMSGSYRANLKGGVLRKNVSRIANNTNPAMDEINLGTGQFNAVTGIISNINSLRIASYSFANSRYEDCSTHSITIDTIKNDARDSNRYCSDWGNPIGEIMLETIRYMAGRTRTAAFHVNDASASGSYPGITGLTRSAWIDPMPADYWCSSCSTILLSTGSNSFDGDNLDVADLPGLTGAAGVNAFTDEVGTLEFGAFAGRTFFSGGSTRQCTATTLTGLSALTGICPEQPALEGTYSVAGLAYYAKTRDLRTAAGYPNRQTINTYAVDLAESLPSFRVPVGTGSVTFLPACQAAPGTNPWQGCSLIDVQVENLTLSGTNPVSGSYLFYWEDSLWGNDYDLDGAQRISFCVGSACTPAIGNNQIRLVSSVPYANAGNNLRFSYTVTGTTNDGLVTPWSLRPGGNNFDALKTPPDAIPAAVTTTTNTFTAGTSAAILPQKPLYYAAKFGGFNDLDGDGTPNNATFNDNREWDADGDGIPDNYFGVSNPALLEASLERVLQAIVGAAGSATSVSANSTRLTEGSTVYQAVFNSRDWSGTLKALTLRGSELVAETLSTDTTFVTTGSIDSGRKVFTYDKDADELVDFTWENLTPAQKTALQAGGSEQLGIDRLNWLRGSRNNEAAEDGTGGALRHRTNLLGDIINSSPAYSGNKNMRYERLPGEAGATYRNYSKQKVLYVGANDGMLHAFNAETFQEIFAYVPSMVYPKLANLTRIDYGRSSNPHQYLVDGPLYVGDAYLNNAWRTVVVGTLGAGGRGVFALDVTNPAEPTVLFEIDSDDYPQLGYVLGQPLVVPMKNGRWAAVFGNGYRYDGTSTSQLFVVDLERPNDPAYTKVLDTGAGRGLSAPSLLPNLVGQVEYAYAGDLRGNLWKFDLSNISQNSWSVSYGAPLFVARDANNNIQPISTSPTLGLNPLKNNAVMVYFGTGKYFDVGDNTAPVNPRHSFYAIADTGAAITYTSATRSVVLHQKDMTQTGSNREITNERDLDATVSLMDWTTKVGWFLDFDEVNGERVTTKPLLVFDRLIFTTLIPSEMACDYGGNGWLMELVAVGNKNIAHSILGDLANSELLNAVLGNLSVGVGNGGEELGIIPCDIKGDCTLLEGELAEGSRGRMSWRQVR